MSDRWNEALEAAAKAVAKLAGDAWDKYKRGHGPERANPHWQGVADGLEDAHEAILALREADPGGREKAAPAPPGPDYEALIAGRLRSIHAELLAAAEEERRNV